MRRNLIVFDVDGTLLDTSEGVLSSVKFAIRNTGHELPSDAVLKTFIGPPVQDSFSRLFGVVGDERNRMADLFRTRYKNIDLLKAEPYEGIFDLFEALADKNIAISIATYKRQDYAETIVKYFGFDKYTNIICGADFNGKLKKSDIIAEAVNLSGSSVGSAVMVGDTIQDNIGAGAVGMDFIAVTYGFGFKHRRDIDSIRGTNVIGIAYNPLDILSILERGKNEN